MTEQERRDYDAEMRDRARAKIADETFNDELHLRALVNRFGWEAVKPLC